MIPLLRLNAYSMSDGRAIIVRPCVPYACAFVSKSPFDIDALKLLSNVEYASSVATLMVRILSAPFNER